MFSKLLSIKNKILKPKPMPPMYELIGEEKGVYRLVKNFYDIMESDPKAIDCLNVHELVDGAIADEVKKKLFMFICGWAGGPNLFVERYGPPRMRARHMHVPISKKESSQWIYCMEKALKMHMPKLKKQYLTIILNSFKALASRIQNQ